MIGDIVHDNASVGASEDTASQVVSFGGVSHHSAHDKSAVPEAEGVSSSLNGKHPDDEAYAASPAEKPVRTAGRRFYYATKRAFDIVFSATALTILFVPSVALGIAISLESPGGPVFRQKRIGKDGREISVFKFRSMYIDAHSNPEKYLNEKQMDQWIREQKVKNDPRITRIGRFIRKASIDEIPQFLNVLVGDMSVIGPRPVTISETYEYGNNRSEVLSVRPGITGWWQVNDRNDATWDSGRRQELELWYVRHISPSVDFMVFMRTFGTMFGKSRSGQ